MSLILIAQKITDQDFTSDQARFEFICEHICQINKENLKNIPKFIIYDLISNGKFANHDQYAKFIIENKEIIGNEYLENIIPDNLSDEMIHELSISISFDELPKFKQTIVNQLIKRIPEFKTNSKEKSSINLLYVTIDSKATINFNFLNDLNNDQSNNEFEIKLKTIFDKQLESILKIDNDYLHFFDIIVVGGCDSFAYYSSHLTDDFFSCIKKHHNKNGILLTLHDVVYSKYVPKFKPLADLIGYKSENGHSVFEEVHFNESIKDTSIISSPFLVGEKFKVAQTHQTPQYDPNNVVVFGGDNISNYYSENLDEHIADLQMGHTIEITDSEKKFFYNVVCHLYKHAEHYDVKTKV